MKKNLRLVFCAFTLLLSLVSFLCVASCSFKTAMPDSVEIDDKTYKLAFVGDLYPTDDIISLEGVRLSGYNYYKYSETQFECYITYDRNAEPNVYFLEEEYEAAIQYYSSASNFDFFCLMGNIHDESDSKVYTVQNIDSDMFEQLIEFAKNNDYNPLTAADNEGNLHSIAISDPYNWTDDEVHFYKESKDGAFSTLKGYTFVLTENRLVLLYQYDFSNEDAPQMQVCALPKAISDYFCTMIGELNKGVSE